MGGVESSFHFDAYKIDRIVFSTLPELNFLTVTGTLDPNGWKFNVGFREPYYFKGAKKYVGGIDVKLTYPIPPVQADESAGTPEEKNLVTLEIGIAGAFSVEEGKFEKSTEENLVKVQIPMILFPYVRAAITSIFAHSGLGSVYFPLINVQELAKSAALIIREIE